MISTILTILFFWFLAGFILNVFFKPKPISAADLQTKPKKPRRDLIAFFEGFGNG